MDKLKKATIPTIITILVVGAVLLNMPQTTKSVACKVASFAGVPCAPTPDCGPEGCPVPPVTPTPEPAPVIPTWDDTEVAKLVIKSPDSAKVGELVEIDLSESVGHSFKWLVSPDTPNFRIEDNGRRLLFCHGHPTTFRLVVATAINGTVDVSRVIIRIEAADPPPTPPEPEPLPSGLDALVQGWMASVESPNKRDETMLLAQNFSSTSAMVAAGVIKSTEDLIKATAKTNKDTLGANLVQWKPFLEGLRLHLNQLAKDGGLNSVQDNAKLWREIAAAMKRSL